MNVTIVGGGIIGLCSAYYLNQLGYDVQIIDDKRFSNSCSHGNGGLIVPSHVVPLAAPGMIAQGLKWMFRSDSPFSFKMRLDPDLIAWAWRFYRAASPEKVAKSIPILAEFSNQSRVLFHSLIQQTQIEAEIRSNGLLMLFKNDKTAHEEIEVAQKANKAGVQAQVLNAKQVAELDPSTTYDILGAVYYPNDAHLNPTFFQLGLRKYLEQKGVLFIPESEITAIETMGDKVTSIASSQKQFAVDHLLLTAGVWTSNLLKKVGVRLLMEDGKGYSYTLNKPEHSSEIPSILLEARAFVTPMHPFLRVGGTMEMSGLSSKINMRRFHAFYNAVQEYYPLLNLEQPTAKRVWSGFRPCSFDGLPYIGKIEQYSNLSVATGHAMMGVSLAPATGKLISEIISDQKPTPVSFNPNR